jgi:hypothetical protein
MPLASMFSAAADAAATHRSLFDYAAMPTFSARAMCAMRYYAAATHVCRRAPTFASRHVEQARFATPCCRYASGMLALRRRRYRPSCRQPRHAADAPRRRQYAYRYARSACYALRRQPRRQQQATPPKLIPAAMHTQVYATDADAAAAIISPIYAATIFR